jgi:signal transduction histidine kinase
MISKRFGAEGSQVSAPNLGSRVSWRPALTVMPYVILALLTAAVVPLEISKPRSMFIDLALCVVTAAWMLGMFTLRPSWQSRVLPMAVFVGGFVVLLALLVMSSGWFGFLAVAGYIYAFWLLPWPWRLIAVVAVAACAGTAQAAWANKDTVSGLAIWGGIVGLNVLGMSVTSLVDRKDDQMATDRNRMLAELAETNQRLAATLAENAGLHQQLLAQAHEAGTLDERQRIAREIHDVLAQGFAGVITQLQAAAATEDLGPQDTEATVARQRHIAAATALARESLTEARRSVHELRPGPLETARLPDALSEVGERWSVMHGIPVQVTVTGPVRALPPEADFALLRAAQEALANVAKHAEAGRVGLTLSYMDDNVALDVRDDGKGFEPSGISRTIAASRAPETSGGFGLVAMRQRIEALAGTLQVESEPGGGTAVFACVPAGTSREST